MTSLAETYDGGGDRLGRRRTYLGTGLFAVGAIMVIVAILLATTDLIASNMGVYAARELAGILAGLGVPATFVGIFIVLPASGTERAIAAIGASVAVLGVLLFWQVYPEQWVGASQNHLTLPVVAVYFLGAITTFWGLFTAVVNVKIRNDPGGTVTLERIIRRVQGLDPTPPEPDPEPSTGHGSGIGILGDIDREAVLEEDATADAEVMTTPASDGGTATAGSVGDGAEVVGTRSSPNPARGGSSPDRYCGSCQEFDYVRTDSGMQPYCGYFDEVMDDMEACEHWEPHVSR